MTGGNIKGLPARRLAVEVLLKVELEGAFANTALSNAFKNHSLTERDRAFATYIVHGTLRHQVEIDEIIKKFSKKPIAKLSPALRAVLRTAFYQLLHMDEMPASAVVNTSVELARKTGHEGSAKFVNGILREFMRREKSTIAQVGGAETSSAQASDEASKDEELSKAQLLSIKYSMPEWLVKRWLSRYGEDECSTLLEASQAIPRLTLRTNEMSISTEGLMDILERRDMKIERSRICPSCLQIIERGRKGGPLSKIPGYSEGLFSIQDEASALVSLVLSPKPGQTIVDLCAAPGGKSLHMAEMMENKGRVIAVDISKKRLDMIGAERRRLGLSNIEAVLADGSKYKTEQACDAVLIDAPCSGTGVMHRRSDIRRHRKEEDLQALVEIQRSLLENAAAMLKVGGLLVYSTCSIEPCENEENIEHFLAEHPEFKPESLEPYLPSTALSLWQSGRHWAETQKELQAGRLQLLPSRHSCSGFFICRLKKEPG